MNFSTTPIIGKTDRQGRLVKGATRVGCPKSKCKGVTFSLNDGAARLAEHFGRSHYQCDICRSRWSVEIVGSAPAPCL